MDYRVRSAPCNRPGWPALDPVPLPSARACGPCPHLAGCPYPEIRCGGKAPLIPRHQGSAWLGLGQPATSAAHLPGAGGEVASAG